jgi:HD-GYP domain-containing protein (c-di-GMP phosphodiesterase class II)
VAQRSELRTAELVAALSLATDLGMGQPLEHELRSCLVAVRLGQHAGLDDDELAEMYYVTLLRWIGCTSHAHELSDWFDDEITAHARSIVFDWGKSGQVLADLVRHAGAGRPPLARLRTAVGAIAAGRDAVGDLFLASCEVGERLALRLSLPPSVGASLAQVFERWDGAGWPARRRGEELRIASRLAQLAQDVVVFARLGGVEAAVAAAQKRAGSLYDPALVETFRRVAADVLSNDYGSLWEAVVTAEPGNQPTLGGEALDEALAAVADFADLKSPFTAGHSPGVAALAAAAARTLGADEQLARRAALVHDLGRAGVPNGIWDKPGALSDAEWERVRLHPYLTERMLTRPALLAELGAAGSLHHERLDGSGYYRGVPGRMLSPVARILAAADAYHAMTEPRPHRTALTPDHAGRELRAEARKGRLDGEAVEAVLAAAGHRPRRRPERPAGLTARELDVLRLVARGRSNRQIGAALVISPRTAEHHVQSVYAKIGVSTRAAAALFAMEQGLLGAPEDG